jgi:hypothetical protein
MSFGTWKIADEQGFEVRDGRDAPASKKEIMAHAQKGSHGFVVVPLEEREHGGVTCDTIDQSWKVPQIDPIYSGSGKTHQQS